MTQIARMQTLLVEVPYNFLLIRNNKIIKRYFQCLLPADVSIIICQKRKVQTMTFYEGIKARACIWCNVHVKQEYRPVRLVLRSHETPDPQKTILETRTEERFARS